MLICGAIHGVSNTVNTVLTIYLIAFAFLNIPMWYMHRHVTHKSVELSPALVAVAKIMLWMRNTRYHSVNTFRIWAAVHLKHHKNVDTVNDPHSPIYRAMYDIVFNRRDYIPESEVQELTKDINLTPVWIDKYLDRYPYGPYVLLVIFLLGFSSIVSAVVCWLIVLAVYRIENVFNLIMHTWPGYVNSTSNKSSRARNLFPLCILIYSGEELHGNHHTWPGRSNNAVRWWEFDLSYLIFKLLSLFNLVKLNEPGNISNLKLKFIK